MIIQTYIESKCPTCGLNFLPVEWLEWRSRGYCQKKCDPTYKEEPAEIDPEEEAQGKLF